MTLQELLQQRGLTSALIVDDGYDEVPRAQDLVRNKDGWNNFFADAAAYEADILREFPKYGEARAADLPRNDEFVAALWRLKGVLSDEVWDGLFSAYEQGNNEETIYLKALEESLLSFGVEPIRSGREVNERGRHAPIIFADLLLGASQEDTDMEASIKLLRDLLKGRGEKPPIVVLMSGSSRLATNKAFFRDEAGLLGAMFRVREKKQLQDRTVVGRTLESLARHHADALRMAEFIHAWTVGLDEARNRFLRTIRRLDLPDYGHIQQLLLDDEKQPLGSYMLDVFDRVLQHEIEASSETIQAAQELNKIETGNYPPPYVAGSADLQQLVHAVLFQNSQRLRLAPPPSAARVSFGDILLRRPDAKAQDTVDGAAGEGTVKSSPLEADVFVVVTPACDLARKGAKRVMLMAGSLEELTAKSWTSKASGARTPILILRENNKEKRFWIRWDLKNITTVSPEHLETALGEGGSHQVIARLRDGQAIELQQKLLSDLGRVGVVANMPYTFPVRVEVMTCEKDESLRRLTSPLLDKEGAVWISGRRDADDAARLVLSEGCIEELLLNIASLDQNQVYGRAADSLKRLKEATYFPALLEQGLALPKLDKGKFKSLAIQKPVSIGAIPVTGEGEIGEQEGKTAKPESEKIGLIVRDPDTFNLTNDEKKHASFIIVLRETPPDTVGAMRND
ncbi:MAG TPA: hypothetical protein VED40_23350 [Azospirillaceae bacterium]|nr:hypothetical protein [Azospirillaceae bacterium]